MWYLPINQTPRDTNEKFLNLKLCGVKIKNLLRTETSILYLSSVSDAIFVVYNYVRLKTILNTYHSKVEQNIYPPLPSIELTEFSLLSKDVSHWRKATHMLLNILKGDQYVIVAIWLAFLALPV